MYGIGGKARMGGMEWLLQDTFAMIPPFAYISGTSLVLAWASYASSFCFLGFLPISPGLLPLASCGL